jgi:hypothetical protein
MLRRTILDHSRDKLFDLRDELRAHFISNGWDLNLSIYKELRTLLNGHLRFTENFSIWKIAFFEVSVKHDKNLQELLQTRNDRAFSVNDPEQIKFVKYIREKALVAVMEYAVFSSGFLLFLSLCFAPFVLIAHSIKIIQRGLGVASKVFFRSILDFSHSTSAVMASSAKVISRHIFIPNLVEDYSYRKGKAC